MKTWLRLTIPMLIALALDGLSKYWAEHTLILHQPVPVWGRFFQLTLGYNSGIAFGLFSEGGVWVLIVVGLGIMGLAWWLISGLLAGEFPPPAAWVMGLLFGGAIANLIDRLGDGRVTDFLDFGLAGRRWPAFNLADSFIVVGLAILLLMGLKESEEEPDEDIA